MRILTLRLETWSNMNFTGWAKKVNPIFFHSYGLSNTKYAKTVIFSGPRGGVAA